MFDIEGWVARNFVDYKWSNGNMLVNCPMCEERTGRYDTKFHMGIHGTKPAVHCFRCDFSSDWIGLIMAVTGQTYAMALGELYVRPTAKDFSGLKERYGPSLGQSSEISAELDSTVVPEGFQILSIRNENHKSAIKYMRWRGFKLSTCRRYRLGVSDEYPYRVIIPVEDDYWQGRAIFKFIQPKYINPSVKSRHYIWNSRALNMYDEVVICEGAFSGMAIGDNAIALISKEATSERMERLRQSSVSKFIVTIEPGAYGSMQPLIHGLYRAGKDVVVWKYSTGDPADPDGIFQEYPYDYKHRVLLKLEAWDDSYRRW